jgi:hypothetical protein
MPAPVFQQLIPTFAGSAPVTSPSYTPNGARNSLLFIINSGGGTNINFLVTGSASTGFAQLTTINASSGGTQSLFDCLSCASGPQTFTINDQIANFDEMFIGIEYSGVGSITNSVMTNLSAPGTGAGAVAGVSVTVPSGSLLLATPVDISAGNETLTTATGGSTNRGSSAVNPIYDWAEWVGTGAPIQPTFTTSANGTNNYVVIQFILNPTLSISSGPLPQMIIVSP